MTPIALLECRSNLSADVIRWIIESPVALGVGYPHPVAADHHEHRHPVLQLFFDVVTKARSPGLAGFVDRSRDSTRHR